MAPKHKELQEKKKRLNKSDHILYDKGRYHPENT